MMRRMLTAMILGAAIALNIAAAFAADTVATGAFFYGDGFDNTTCADSPKDTPCR